MRAETSGGREGAKSLPGAPRRGVGILRVWCGDASPPVLLHSVVSDRSIERSTHDER